MATHVADAQNCDICRHEFQPGQDVYDVRTKLGPWGTLCSSCYSEVGIGLGPGRGQRYKHGSHEKVDG